MRIVIDENEDGFYVVEVNGKEITKQNNPVQAAKKLYNYLKGQS